MADPNHLLQIICQCVYGVAFSRVYVPFKGVRCACTTEIIPQ